MPADRVVHATGLATTDLEELADYFLRHAGRAVAVRFVEQAERAFQQLVATPGLGALLGLDELPYEDIRRWHVGGFDRLMILYRPTTDGIEVIRVLHTARHLPDVLRDETGA